VNGSRISVEQQIAFLSAFFDRAQDAVAFVDRDLILCTANAAFALRLGLPATEIVGRRAEDLLPGLNELAGSEVAAVKENLDLCTGFSPSRSGDVGDPCVRASVSSVMGAGGFCLGYMVRLQDLDEGKRVEDALRASEARLLTAQRSAHIGNWERNLQTNELWWSDEDFRILGLDPSHVSPSFEAFMAVVDPVDVDFVRRSVADAYENNGAFDIDVRIIRPGGSRGVVNARSEVLFDESGRPRLMTGTVQDISSRKRAEDALTRFKLGIERSNEAIFMTDVEGAITYANPAFEATFGYATDEALGQTPRILKSGVVPQEYYKVFWDTLLAGKPAVGEIVNKTKDGRFITIECSNNPILDERGDIIGFLSIQRDITERRLADEALRDTTQRLKEMVQASPSAIIASNRSGELTIWNPAAERMFGWEASELLGHPMPLPILPQSEVADYIDKRDRMLADGETFADEETFRLRKDGTLIEVSVSHAPMRDAAGAVVGLVTLMSDISARKLAERQLKASLDKLNQALEESVQAMSLTVEMRDPYTAGHERRVAALAVAISRKMGLLDEQVKGIRVAGLLHDIGKIALPAEILSKPGRLTDPELTLIRVHPETGYDILKTVEFPWPVADIVRQHHERLDGKGYPRGLTTADILLEAKILAVADVVEAMSSHRPYRPAHAASEALREIRENSLTSFDPEVVEACLWLFEEQGFTFD